jgi:hypothetical protein
MSYDDKTDDYKVGYRRPPEHTRFKKGRSGNPGGRPRKTGAVEVDLEGWVNQSVTVVQNGQARRMSKREVMLRAHLKKALNESCLKSMIYLFEAFEKYGAIELPIEHSGGVVHLPSTMPWPMAVSMFMRFEVPPWTKKQLDEGRAAYLATRTDEQKQEDDLMEYKDL